MTAGHLSEVIGVLLGDAFVCELLHGVKGWMAVCMWWVWADGDSCLFSD